MLVKHKALCVLFAGVLIFLAEACGSELSTDPEVAELKTTTLFSTAAAFSHQQHPNQASLPHLTTANGQIIDPTGQKVYLHGINWFGFNNQQTAVDGLWSGTALSADFATVVWRIKALGFNAIRLPFSFQDLYHLPPKNFRFSCQQPTALEVAQSITPPGKKPVLLAPLAYAPARQLAVCNDYLPSSSTFDRFVWVVKFLAHNGFYVLIDNHLREDQTALNDFNTWIANWQTLISALADDPVVTSHLLVDVLNEPDQFGLRWEKSNGQRSLTTLYLTAMQAISSIVPVVFLVEGTGQSSLHTSWGDGYATDPRLLKDLSLGLSDPTEFFEGVIQQNLTTQIVLAPHVYGPAVTGNSQVPYSAGLPFFKRLSQSFGYITKQGYLSKNKQSYLFPVAIGEFGSSFSDPFDIQTMTDLALYLKNQGIAKDGQHNPIHNWFYWAWNANSGDTGGLVDNNWSAIVWTKLSFLQHLGLAIASSSSSSPSPSTAHGNVTLCANVSAIQPAIPNQTSNGNAVICPNTLYIAPAILDASSISSPGTTPASQANVVLTADMIQTSPNTFSCRARLSQFQLWQTADGYGASIQVTIENTSTESLAVPWSVSWQNPAYTSVQSAWNWDIAQTISGNILGTVTENWSSLAAAGHVEIGAVVVGTKNTLKPQTVSVSGISCSWIEVP